MQSKMVNLKAKRVKAFKNKLCWLVFMILFLLLLSRFVLPSSFDVGGGGAGVRLFGVWFVVGVQGGEGVVGGCWRVGGGFLRFFWVESFAGKMNGLFLVFLGGIANMGAKPWGGY